MSATPTPTSFSIKDIVKDNATSKKIDAVPTLSPSDTSQVINQLGIRISYDDLSVTYLGAIVLIGIASFIIAKYMFSEEGEYKASEQIEQDTDVAQEVKKLGIAIRLSRPFFKRYFTPIVHSMKSKKKYKERYKRDLATSGLTQIISPEDFYAYKLFMILGFPFTYVFIREFLGEDWPLAYLPLAGVVGYFWPNLWLYMQVKKRQQKVIEEMPFVVDLLALSVEAGLDFIAAITKVIEKAKPGPIVEEFTIVLKEIQVGSSRSEALRKLSWRMDMMPISSFCATLIAADAIGASIGPILKTLADEVRRKRSSEIEKKGAKAATKILLPMILFLLPAVLIIILGPMAVSYIGAR